MAEDRLEVVDPTSGPLDRSSLRKPAVRPTNLDGAVVALVVNGFGEADRLLEALYEEISHLAETIGKIKVVKHGVSVPPEKADWLRITSEATVGITAFGG